MNILGDLGGMIAPKRVAVVHGHLSSEKIKELKRRARKTTTVVAAEEKEEEPKDVDFEVLENVGNPL